MELVFHPVTSHAYDLAREEYQEGVFEMRLRFHDKPNRKSNIYCLRMHLVNCVSLLEALYYVGQVECIGELPSREEVTTSNKAQLKSLSDKLGELYFPDVN